MRREETGERDSGGGVCRWVRPGGYLVAGNSRHFIQIIIVDLTQPAIIVNEHVTTLLTVTVSVQCTQLRSRAISVLENNIHVGEPVNPYTGTQRVSMT